MNDPISSVMQFISVMIMLGFLVATGYFLITVPIYLKRIAEALEGKNFLRRIAEALEENNKK